MGKTSDNLNVNFMKRYDTKSLEYSYYKEFIGPTETDNFLHLQYQPSISSRTNKHVCVISIDSVTFARLLTSS